MRAYLLSTRVSPNKDISGALVVCGPQSRLSLYGRLGNFNAHPSEGETVHLTCKRARAPVCLRYQTHRGSWSDSCFLRHYVVRTSREFRNFHRDAGLL